MIHSGVYRFSYIPFAIEPDRMHCDIGGIASHGYSWALLHAWLWLSASSMFGEPCWLGLSQSLSGFDWDGALVALIMENQGFQPAHTCMHVHAWASWNVVTSGDDRFSTLALDLYSSRVSRVGCSGFSVVVLEPWSFRHVCSLGNMVRLKSIRGNFDNIWHKKLIQSIAWKYVAHWLVICWGTHSRRSLTPQLRPGSNYPIMTHRAIVLTKLPGRVSASSS